MHYIYMILVYFFYIQTAQAQFVPPDRCEPGFLSRNFKASINNELDQMKFIRSPEELRGSAKRVSMLRQEYLKIRASFVVDTLESGMNGVDCINDVFDHLKIGYEVILQNGVEKNNYRYSIRNKVTLKIVSGSINDFYRWIKGSSSILGNVIYSNSFIEEAVINNSIETYGQTCPCPYSLDSVGDFCGERSAWSITGGKTPVCHPTQIAESLKDRLRDLMADNRQKPIFDAAIKPTYQFSPDTTPPRKIASWP